MIEKQINSQNGIQLATAGCYCEENINILPNLQIKSVTPNTKNQTITADDGFCGLGEVIVKKIGSTYAKNTKKWKVTLTSNITDNTPLVTDSWLATHKNDSNLVIFIAVDSQIAVTSTTAQYLGGWCGNVLLGNMGSNDVYGLTIRKVLNGNSLQDRPNTTSVGSPTNGTGGQIKVTDSGGIYIYGVSANYVVPAGTWIIIATLV